MCARDLPDMYALIPRACGPRDEGLHIRQIPRAHVTTITCMPMFMSHSGGSESSLPYHHNIIYQTW